MNYFLNESRRLWAESEALPSAAAGRDLRVRAHTLFSIWYDLQHSPLGLDGVE